MTPRLNGACMYLVAPYLLLFVRVTNNLSNEIRRIEETEHSHPFRSRFTVYDFRVICHITHMFSNSLQL